MEAGEEERRCATGATVLATLPESAPTRMRATAGAGVAGEGERATLCATAVTELDTSHGSALRVTAAVMLGAVVDMEVAATWAEAAVADTENLADLAAVVATSATGVVDPSATSATGLDTLLASAGRK